MPSTANAVYDVSWITPEMRAAGFVAPDLAQHHKIDVATSGAEKKGKTHWAFTAPKPLAAISSDTGTEAIAQKFRLRGERVAVFPYRVPKEAEARADKEKEWIKLEKALYACIRNKSLRTVVIDTADEIWAMLRMARFGKLSQVMPHHYGPVNSEMKDLIKEACDRADLNTVWIHKVKKEYKTGKDGKDNWTGQYERAGFADMPYLVDVLVEHYYDWSTGNMQFATRVLDTRLEPETTLGLELVGDMCNFKTLAMCCHPEVADECWD